MSMVPFFKIGMTMNDIGTRAHGLTHPHERCMFSVFDKNLHEESVWTGTSSVLSFALHRSIFLHFVKKY